MKMILPLALVLAAGAENRKDHQIGIGEEQFTGLDAGGFRNLGKFSQMLIEGEGAKVRMADAGKGGNLVFGEEFLARLDPHHFFRLERVLMQAPA